VRQKKKKKRRTRTLISPNQPKTKKESKGTEEKA